MTLENTPQHANTFHGPYGEEAFIHVLGGWSQREFEENVAADMQRRILTLLSGGNIVDLINKVVRPMTDKDIKCADASHPLWESYQTIMQEGMDILETQLSDVRIQTDLEKFLATMFSDKKIRTSDRDWKKKLVTGFFESVKKQSGKIRTRVGQLLQEASMNVIEHGMKHDPRGVGVFSMGMTPQGDFDMTTFSERNFDWRTAVDNAFDFDRPSGRGILYITSMPDAREFSEGGRCLAMRFHVRHELQTALVEEAGKQGVEMDFVPDPRTSLPSYPTRPKDETQDEATV